MQSIEGRVRAELAAKLLALGTNIAPPMVAGTIALCAAELPPFDEALVQRDIAYGPDARHRLDLFGSAPGGDPRPVFIYIHGGGFVMGDKGGPADPFYNNIGAWAARQGWLGVTATYRLAPASRWPSGIADMALLVEWLGAHAAAHGGDPRAIFLAGQSAGAAHVASYVGGPRAAEAERLLAGAVMLSGLYDVAAAERNHFQAAYYGEDPAAFAAQSSIDGLLGTSLPCLYAVAEHDPLDFQRQAALLVSRHVEAKGVWPDIHRLAGHNHLSPAQLIGSGMGPEALIADFVARAGR